MDNGASSYRRFLNGDDNGIIEIVNDYKDGLILYLTSFVDNIYTAEELTEETFFRMIVNKPKYFGQIHFLMILLWEIPLELTVIYMLTMKDFMIGMVSV